MSNIYEHSKEPSHGEAATVLDWRNDSRPKELTHPCWLIPPVLTDSDAHARYHVLRQAEALLLSCTLLTTAPATASLQTAWGNSYTAKCQLPGPRPQSQGKHDAMDQLSNIRLISTLTPDNMLDAYQFTEVLLLKATPSISPTPLG